MEVIWSMGEMIMQDGDIFNFPLDIFGDAFSKMSLNC